MRSKFRRLRLRTEHRTTGRFLHITRKPIKICRKHEVEATRHALGMCYSKQRPSFVLARVTLA